VFQLKRLVPVAVAIVALFLLPGSATANGGQTKIEQVPGNFVMTSADCVHLPPGTTITGTGTGRSITRTTTNRSGITTVVNSTVTPGTATDQAGNAYRFFYSNQFRVSNTAADRTRFSGPMVDLFLLSGRGPAKLRNGFVATFVTNFAGFSRYYKIAAFGDPITFPTGVGPFCDPL
jgi:hypothetical protein